MEKKEEEFFSPINNLSKAQTGVKNLMLQKLSFYQRDIQQPDCV